jgi:hypothetical protein
MKNIIIIAALTAEYLVGLVPTSAQSAAKD